MNWLDGGDLPKTIVDSYFNPMRLLMLQTRRSAAYKGGDGTYNEESQP
jgi:hypothetical protein